MIEVIPTRSRNNNVFIFGSYWGHWSRILFHDPHGSRGMQQMRERHNIPQHIRTIEIDLTAINPFSDLHWRDRVQYVNIRCHCTAISPRDKIVGALPPEAVALMKEWLPESTIEMLLHGDYLPLLDFDKIQANHLGGGSHFHAAFKGPISYAAYAAQNKAAGDTDTSWVDRERSYSEYLSAHLDAVAKLLPHEFKLEARF